MAGPDSFELHDARDRPLCRLNETASALWDLCDGETSVGEMIDAVCLACDVEPDQAAGDISRALDELASAGVLEWEEGR